MNINYYLCVTLFAISLVGFIAIVIYDLISDEKRLAEE